MMTMTTATTMPMTVTSANRIQTAAFCHQADGACGCWAFGIAGGDHVGGPSSAPGPVTGYGAGVDQLGIGGGTNGGGGGGGLGDTGAVRAARAASARSFVV